MSVVLFMIVAALAAGIDEAITSHLRAARAARKLPRRARVYKFT